MVETAQIAILVNIFPGRKTMSDGDFSGYIARERARLNGEREAVFNQQQELENKLASLNKELLAIDAYEAAKSGKAMSQAKGMRGRPARGGPRQTRKGSKREGLINILQQNRGGLSRGEILTKMGLKGDKSGEMSVSNALTALTKSGAVRRHDGKYHIAA